MCFDDVDVTTYKFSENQCQAAISATLLTRLSDYYRHSSESPSGRGMVLSLTKQGKEKMFYVLCMGVEAVFSPAETGVVRTGLKIEIKTEISQV